jgi:drug/metabolite transporter (DMT)-like permease
MTSRIPDSLHHHDPVKGLVFKLVSVFFFSLMGLQIKLLEQAYPTSQILFSRSAFALIPLVPLIFFSGGWAILKVRSPRALLLRNMVGFVAMILTFWSLPHVPLATFTAIQFTMPLFAAVLAALFIGERMSSSRLLTVITGFAGALLILRPSSATHDFFMGIALLAAFVISISTIILRRLTATERGLAIVFWFTVFSMSVSGLWMLTGYIRPTLHDAILLVGSGLAGGMGQVLLTHSYRFGQVSLLTAFEYTGLIWASLFELIFWNQLPDLQVFAGAAIIILSGLALLRQERKNRKLANVLS